MDLLQSLENFTVHLETTVDDLRALRRDFCETFGALAREGAELFTLGFEEMMVKQNNAWKTSAENFMAARAMVRDAHHRYPELAEQYDQASSRLEKWWQAAGMRREECWEMLQELSAILAPGSKDGNPAVYVGIEWEGDHADEQILPNLPASLAATDATVSDIIACIEESAYLQVLRDQGLDLRLKIVDAGNDHGWLQQVWDHHTRSEDEYRAAIAHADDRDAVCAYTNGVCQQFERLSELAHRAALIFHVGAIRSMAGANDMERWIENYPADGAEFKKIQEGFASTINIARSLADLITCPLTVESGGLAVANPTFVEKMQIAEDLLYA